MTNDVVAALVRQNAALIDERNAAREWGAVEHQRALDTWDAYVAAQARADEAEARLALERETRRAAGAARYSARYLAMRDVARAHGYALAVHGSQERDLDLVAVPWTGAAGEPAALAQALAAAVDGVLVDGPPAVKPHGRLVWQIHVGGAAYVDLGVLPRNVWAQRWKRIAHYTRRKRREDAAGYSYAFGVLEREWSAAQARAAEAEARLADLTRCAARVVAAAKDAVQVARAGRTIGFPVEALEHIERELAAAIAALPEGGRDE